MSNNLSNLIQQAESLRAQNNLAEALGVYKKICKIDKNNANAWLAYGAVAGNLGKLSDAESAFRKACNIHNTYGKQHEFLLQALDVQGKYDDAIKILLKYKSSADAPADIALKIGLMYGKNNAYKESINWLEKYINEGNSNGFAHHCLAAAYESIEQTDKAEYHFQQAIILNGKDFQLHNNYGGFLQKRGKLDAAIDQYSQAIKLNEQYPFAWYNLGNAYSKSGIYDKALLNFTSALRLKPDYVEAIVGIGKCHYSMTSYTQAIDAFNKALTLDENCTEAISNLGLCNAATGDYDSAFKALEKAMSLDPEDIEIKCSLVTLYEKYGDFHTAESIIRPLINSHPGHMEVVSAYATLCKHMNECDSALNYINQCLLDEAISPMLQSSLEFKAGKICDDLKLYDKAFSYYESANNLIPTTYDATLSRQSLNNIKSLFSSDAMRSLPGSKKTTKSPIFILGMPRSGTTLVEQIISSHPQVYGAGELPYLGSIANSLFGQSLTGNQIANNTLQIDSGKIDMLADEYLNNSRINSAGETYITDKMPHNFRLIGLINILFPNAKIIHCIRNPIDNCLSIYFSHFNASHPYAYKLTDMSSYYTDYYQALMSHWKEVSTIDIHDVIYEELVTHQEDVTRDLLEYCELEWSDKCLDFHKSDRVATTISYDQVRQPMYTKSRGRWRNYEKHISPLLEHFENYIT